VKHGEAINRLAEELGADISLNLHPLATPTKHDRRHVNADLINKFKGCDVALYEFAPEQSWITVIWDRPNNHTDQQRITLRRAFIEARIWDHNVTHLWAVPELLKRPATTEDNARYRPWLLEAVQAAGARYVLLVGSRASWQWRPDLPLSKTQGKAFLWRQKQVVYPVISPLNISKADILPWRKQIARFCQIVHDSRDLDALSDTCVECGKQLWWYDSDGVAWCRDHVAKGVAAQEKGASKWATLTMSAGHIDMFPPGS
jgi:hypothetical protein